jgi:hypothetical protein
VRADELAAKSRPFLTMMKERRDYFRRAETLRALVQCLVRRRGQSVTVGELLGAHGALSRAGVERIAKRLALLGLVAWKDAGRWAATPPLLNPVPLVSTNVEA